MIKFHPELNEEDPIHCLHKVARIAGAGLSWSRWLTASREDDQYSFESCLIFSGLRLPRPKRVSVTCESILKEAAKCSEFVEVDPEVRGGKPCIKGTRVPVYAVLNAISQHGSLEAAAKAYGVLTLEQIRGAVDFSARVLEAPIEHEFTPVD